MELNLEERRGDTGRVSIDGGRGYGSERSRGREEDERCREEMAVMQKEYELMVNRLNELE